MATYSKDPKWLTARYPGRCAGCGESIRRGSEIFYYPIGRKVFSGKCADDASRDFQSMTASESYDAY